MQAILDTGPLYAAFDRDDPAHERSAAVFRRADLTLVLPVMVAAEVTFLIGKRLGPDPEARFIAGLAELDVESPHPDDWPRIAELVATYRDFPLGGIDASVVALAERLNTDVIVTLDQRHFRAIRPRHVPAFRLLPE
jgi:predicted nucleic acid-binding protein